MKLQLTANAPKTDILFLALFKGEKLSSNAKNNLGSSLVKEIQTRIKAKDFEGDDGQSLTFYTKGVRFKKLMLIGRGDKKEQMPSATEELGGNFAAKSSGSKSVAILLDEKELSEIAYGFVLGSYEFKRYKKKDKKAVDLKEVHFLSKASKENKAALKSAEIFINSSALLRDLVNTPTGDLNTNDLVNAAKKVAKKHKLKITVFDEKKLAKLGCNAIVGVGQGATHGSRMVFIEYKHKSKSKVPNIAFVGKGIVFDTGGLNIKPTNYIETMKQDMAGAATVLATMNTIAEAKMPGHFLAVLCCAENAVSDKATHPGDVHTAYNGKTIEITNTDAEGRLVLADGLSYTEKNYKPKLMVNIATLTGAVSVALGYKITGVMGNNQKLIDQILKLSESKHERMWQLPLDPDFKNASKGDFTDLKNSTNGVRAGSTMGGAFLSNFVEKVPWAHFDIGGTAWAEKPSSTTKYGSTASALRTLTALAESHSG